MEEVPGAREVHRDAGGLRGGDHLGVAHRPAGLHHGAHPALEEHLKPIGEREECIRGSDRTARPPYAYTNLRVSVNDMAPILRASWLRGVSALPSSSIPRATATS